MDKTGITAYFNDVLAVERLGTPCHGCYSYAFTLLAYADTWQGYILMLKSCREATKTLPLFAEEIKVLWSIYDFILVVAHDYWREDSAQ